MDLVYVTGGMAALLLIVGVLATMMVRRIDRDIDTIFSRHYDLTQYVGETFVRRDDFHELRQEMREGFNRIEQIIEHRTS